ncbi:MAG: phosphoenolpyruvate-utilizing N-terminal domain-containing protein [Lachnospiraceae bacterium]|nr:phosphoenolpyruvate-utilizing N-terminal domain-containing protein [Lachnospiraceae bacterium]
MECLHGKTIAGGMAVGKISIYEKKTQIVEKNYGKRPEDEIRRYENAQRQVLAELQVIYEKAVAEVGEKNAQLFEIHALMLEDEEYDGSVRKFIQREGAGAEYAVAKTGDYFAQMFEQMEDEYFRARSADVRDITERLLAALQGVSYQTEEQREPVILLAEELAPSETVEMDKSKILAFVTTRGTENSHTAILARKRNIPALTQINISKEWEGKMAAVDGNRGILYIEPDEETLKLFS